MGISIIACCAVFVCSMFFNYYIDVQLVEGLITTQTARVFYDAQVMTAKVVCIVTGGCLLITSVIMLFFYIKNYIDTHKKELGILKAMGYSNLSVAKSFYIFGLSVFIGAILGYAFSFIIMPRFYSLQNEMHILPDITPHFNISVLIYFVIMPTVAFAFLSIFYAALKLKRPVLTLIKDNIQSDRRKIKHKKSGTKSEDFLKSLKKSTLSGKKILVFFAIFSAFCFSAMTQMSFSMKDLSSEMMGAIMLIIGLVLAFVSLYIALSTVIRGNMKTISMMRVLGYSYSECKASLLDIYRPFAYIGFAVGSVYQYMLLKIMVELVFKNVPDIPEYNFNYQMMFISLIVFIVIYETVMSLYSRRIRKISLKEIMSE